MAGPSMLPEEDFEDAYRAKFDALILGRGLKVNYERDRAATDIGVMWTKPASRELSGVRVWFQLKGVHTASASAEDVRARGYVPVKLDVGQICFWYAAPEATYLVVYVESLDLFLGRDVRDIVDERWGPGILAPENLRDQASVTVHLPLDAAFDESAVELASRAHRSMRIDGPTFRGRPLGHRFDPLRSELSPLEPGAFERLVFDLLDAHKFRTESEADATRLVANIAPDLNHVRAFTGTFWTTYEYIFAGSVELGFGPNVEPRTEGQTFHAFGRSMVVIHSRVVDSIQPAEDVLEFVAELADREGCENFLVFANCEDHAHNMLFPWRRRIFDGRSCVPQGLRSLAYNVLTATLVYLDNAEHLSWKSLQYNLSVDAVAVAERFRRMSEGLDVP